MKQIIFFLGVIILLSACDKQNRKSGEVLQNDSLKARMENSDVTVIPTNNTDSLITAVEAENARLEASLKIFDKISLSTKDQRAQIRQKWSSINFYLEKGSCVKIVTLPYLQISKRTEEFTFKDGKLILAVISDNGLDEKGDPEKGVDKEYYYSNNQCVKEENRSKESETTIRNSDSERLLQEANEYLSLLPKK